MEGNFSGGGVLHIKEGVSFATTGTVTGITTIRPIRYASWSGSSFMVIDGADADLTKYFTDYTGYDLVKRADGIYAAKPSAVDLTISTPVAPKYGDNISVTVQLKDTAGLTEAAWVKLTLEGNGKIKEFINYKFTGTTTFDLSVLEASPYTVKAELGQPGLAGSATQVMTVSRRPLTVDISALEPWSRPYQKSNKEVFISSGYFASAPLIGYYGADSGGRLVLDFQCRYMLETDGVGQNKPNTIDQKELPLSYESSGSAAEQANAQYVYKNYMVLMPQIQINITPQIVSSITWPVTTRAEQVGTPLSQRQLEGGSTALGTFRWKDGTITPPIGTAKYDVVFTPADTVNYDYSGVAGWDPATKTATQPVQVSTSKKEKPTNKQYAQTSTVQDTDTTVTVDLAAAAKAPSDAGNLRFTYVSQGATEGPLTNIAVSGSSLTFTVPSTATEGENVSLLPITVTSDCYQDFTLTVQVSLSKKTSVTISGISVADLSDKGVRFYNGKASSYQGTPVVVGGYTGPLEYQWYTQSGTLLDKAPINAGQYSLVVKVPDANPTYIGRYTESFLISVVTLNVRAENKSIRPGEEAPAYTAVLEGLVPGEAAVVTLTCNYAKGDPVNGVAGTYRIVPSKCQFITGDAGNYRIGYTDGTLTVGQQSDDSDFWPSTGGGSSSSKPPEVETLPDGTVIKTESSTKTDSATGAKVEQKIVTTTGPDGAITKVETITITGGRDGASGDVTATTDAKGVTTVTTNLVAKAGESKLQIPAAITDITKKADSVSMQMQVGGMTLALNAQSLNAILKVGGSTPTITVTPVAQDKLPESIRGRATAFEFKVGGQGVDFAGGSITVTTAYEKKDASKAVGVFYVAESGALRRIPGATYQNQKVTFSQDHWSIYAIVEEDALPFTDVEESAWYYAAVRYAYEKKITTGTSATTFAPDATCTRAQVVTFLWNALGKPAPSSKVSPFADVQAGSYYYDAVLWAAEKGITGGTGPNSFSPDAVITRGQFVTFLHRSAGTPEVTAENPFTDVADAQAYYYDAVLWAYGQKVTKGTSATTFGPEDSCTRAQVVTFLQNHLEK